MKRLAGDVAGQRRACRHTPDDPAKERAFSRSSRLPGDGGRIATDVRLPSATESRALVAAPRGSGEWSDDEDDERTRGHRRKVCTTAHLPHDRGADGPHSLSRGPA